MARCRRTAGDDQERYDDLIRLYIRPQRGRLQAGPARCRALVTGRYIGKGQLVTSAEARRGVVELSCDREGSTE